MLEFTEDYNIHRLILVNSAASAYTELPMDKTAALFGTNNEGKTSSLSVLKLFLLPEQNFKNCEKKFGFSSTEGAFTGLQSFSYYFPSANSYLICDAENRRGRFTIVLKRSREELGFERIGVPIPYNEVKHLFWDFESSANKGFGKPREDLSSSDVVAELKRRGGVLISGLNSIRESIYSRPGHLDDLSRYSLIPLSDRGEKGSPAALSALLSLAFDIRGLKRDSLPKAIATIIAGENAGKETPLNFNVGQVVSEAVELKEKAKYLAIVSRNKRGWEEVKQAYGDYLTTRRTIYNVAPSVLASAALHIAQAEELIATAAQKHTDSTESANALKKRFSESKQRLRELEAQKKAFSKDLETLSERATRVEAVEAEASSLGLSEEADIIDWLSEEKEAFESEYKSLSDQEAGAARLSELFTRRQKLQGELAAVKDALNQKSEATLTGLSRSSQNHLYSLQPLLAQVHATPTGTQKSTIEDFAALLGTDETGTGLTFLGETIPGLEKKLFSAQEERERLSKHSDTLQRQLDDTDSEYRKLDRELKNAKSPQYRQEKLAELVAEITQAEADIRLLKGKDQLQLDRGIKQEQLDQCLASLQTSSGEHDNHMSAYNESMKAVSESLSELEFAKSTKQSITDSIHTLQISISSQPDLAPLANTGLEEGVDPLPLADITPAASEAASAVKRYPTVKQELVSGLAALSNAGIRIGTNDIAYKALSYDELANIYDAVSSEFNNLEGQQQKLKEDIYHHNSESMSRAARLRQIASTIREFQNQVNEELAAYTISDLSEVKITIGVDRRFNSLVADLENERFQGSELKSDAFYERLNNFAEDFLTGNNKVIQLEQVITDVKFSYVINGVRTDTQQSTGTNCMVNTALLSILLKRLIPKNISLTFPVIFDEVATIDEFNLSTVIDMVENQGFILFGAAPYPTGVVASDIHNWHILSLLKLSEGKQIGKCSVIHYNMREGLTKHDQTHAGVELQDTLGEGA